MCLQISVLGNVLEIVIFLFFGRRMKDEKRHRDVGEFSLCCVAVFILMASSPL